MISVAQSPRFLRALRKLIKKNPSLQKVYREKLSTFLTDPYHPSLQTHKLQGQLNGMLAFSLTHSLRIVFYFKDNTHIVFEDVGSHREVY
jgi:proteic killer suppression protein